MSFKPNKPISLAEILPSNLDQIDSKTGKCKPGSDFDFMLGVLTANYGVSFYTNSPESVLLQKSIEIYNEARRRGWTKERLAKHVKNFIYDAKHKFPTFTIGEFFEGITEIKLKTYSQYLDAVNKLGERLNNDIVWFKFIDASDSTKLQMFWVRRSELNEYQIEYLCDIERQAIQFVEENKNHPAVIEKLARETLHDSVRERRSMPKPEISPEAMLENTRKLLEYAVETIELYNRAIMVHSENPETLRRLNEKYQSQTKTFFEANSHFAVSAKAG